ncbi:MAG: LLM class flavin-dependent oxidoreductase [Actinobacteria bacterium]|nr:LLM class flavin-dependent oxidoreductase [Actinomycetota bacterium]
MSRLTLGLNLSTSAATDADPVADALEAERLGFDFVSANDHPMGGSLTHELWTLLAWVAARTSTIKVASRVLGMPYRNPAVVAKMAASLQTLSGGRLILGVGGGSSDEGIAAVGAGTLTARVKTDGLEDALRIIRGLWTEPGFSYEGVVHSVRDATIEPRPSEPIPIWTGTYGPRGLALTGEVADGWIPSLDLVPPERAQQTRGRILEAAVRAGRAPEAIACIYNLEVRMGSKDHDDSVVSGEPSEIVERLLGFVELGFSGMNFIVGGPNAREQRRRLAMEVLPSLRAAV